MSSEFTLGDYVSLVRGTTYKGDLVNLPGPVLLGLASIQSDGGFRWGAFKTYGGACPPKITLFPGDLYVSLKDVTQSGDLLGSDARVPKQIKSGRLTQDTVKLELSGRPINPSFLYWLLRTPQYRQFCRARATGTTTLGLAREDFLAFPISDPTPSQISLVELLEAIEARIEILGETNTTLEAIAQALFKSWFVDFDPVHANAGTQAPSLPAEIQAIFPSRLAESPQGLIPEGWEWSTIAQSFILTMGQSPPGDTYNEIGDGLPFYQGKTDYGFRFPTQRIFCTSPTRFASRGDCLVSVRAPVGDVNVALENCSLGRGVAGVRHPAGFSSFVLYSLKALKPHFDYFNGEGTVFGSINKKDFQTLPVIAAPESVQRAFDDIASGIDTKIENNELKLRALTMLRDTLLPRLISGQLRLPEAEAALAEEQQ